MSWGDQRQRRQHPPGSTFWSTNTVNYIVAWLNCAKSLGPTINYLGGWNERGYNISWYEQLRSTLNADGYSAVQMVGAPGRQHRRVVDLPQQHKRHDHRAGQRQRRCARYGHLAMSLNGHTISGAIDSTTVGTVTDSTFTDGMAGLGVNGYQTGQFDNLSVTALGSATPTGPIIAGDNTAKCVDDNSDSSANGTKIEMWDCNGGSNQQWAIP